MGNTRADQSNLVKGVDMSQVNPRVAQLATRLSASVQSSWSLASFPLLLPQKQMLRIFGQNIP